MQKIAIYLLIVSSLLTGCSVSTGYVDQMPGNISKEREQKDRETCRRVSRANLHKSGFLYEIKRDCRIALEQILDPRTDLAIFDVSRAYLDALHEYANTVDFLRAQRQEDSLSSNFGAYLVGRQTGLIGAMNDWRYENDLPLPRDIYAPSGDILV